MTQTKDQPRHGLSANPTPEKPIPPRLLPSGEGCTACEGTGWVAETYPHLPSYADPSGVSMPCLTPDCPVAYVPAPEGVVWTSDGVHYAEDARNESAA